MKTIYKYNITSDDCVINMPDSTILTIQYQGDQLCLWAEVNPSSAVGPHHFRVFGTGHDIPSISRKHLGTVQKDGYVWHVYEVWP